MAHVAPWKYKFVDNIVSMAEKYPVMGVVRINNIPALQMQKMRRKLREHGVLIVGKNRLIKIALEKIKKKGIKELARYVDGQIGIIFTDMDAFKLVKILDKAKTKSPAKGGEIAPEDIVVHGGETQFKPGPIISEFQKVGIPAAVQKGKIVIRKDTVVARKGEVISRDLALALTKLEIYPLTVGLELVGAYEDGMVFSRDVLEVDTEKVYGDILNGIQSAINLSVNTWYPTSLTVRIMLGEAYRKGVNLAVNANIINRDTISIILNKAYAQMISLSSKLSDGIGDELKGLISSEYTERKVEEEQEKEEKEEEEEKKEEEAISGLGSLFG